MRPRGLLEAIAFLLLAGTAAAWLVGRGARGVRLDGARSAGPASATCGRGG